MKILYKTTQVLFGSFFKLFYHHKVYGLENLPEGAAIIASNHNSFLDPPMVGASCPEEVYYFARASLFDNYFLNYFIRRLNAYPIKGNTNDLASFKIIASLLKNQKKVLIFPEGVRSDKGSLSPFKHGLAMLALRADCPIIPVYLHGTFDVWSRFRKIPKFKGTTACVFGKPIYPHAYQDLPKKEAQDKITELVRASIENLRAWYVTHYTN